MTYVTNLLAAFLVSSKEGTTDYFKCVLLHVCTIKEVPFTEAGDKGDDKEGMDSASWGRVLTTAMSLSVMMWIFWLAESGQWRVVFGQWCETEPKGK